MSGRGASRKARQKKGAAAVSPQAEGRQAAVDGKTMAACPYHGLGLGKRHAWLKGYAQARLDINRTKRRAQPQPAEPK